MDKNLQLYYKKIKCAERLEQVAREEFGLVIVPKVVLYPGGGTRVQLGAELDFVVYQQTDKEKLEQMFEASSNETEDPGYEEGS